jgi:predicted RNA methylase
MEGKEVSMARLASDAKMGFFPTPHETLNWVCKFLDFDEGVHILDPCCGDGEALGELNWCPNNRHMATTYGVELDTERAGDASRNLDHLIQGSIFEVRINPLNCVGLLWLNPPYGSEGGERVEMRFLKHSIKWLCPNGILVFLVPEPIFEKEKNGKWIAQNFYDCRLFRFHRKDYPAFKQAVMIAKRRAEVTDAELPSPPYQYIEDEAPEDPLYLIPCTEGPKVFQATDSVTDEEVLANHPGLLREVGKLIGDHDGLRSMRPLLPLRKGHLVALLTAGLLDGRMETPEGPIWIKGFSDRVSSTRIEEDKEITCDTYSVGIRVLEKGGGWYDIR